MATAWRISAGTERVRLSADRRVDITFTVTNDGPVDDRAVLDVVPGGAAQESWFTIDEPQRPVSRGTSAPFLVRLDVPVGAPAGMHWVQARVYSSDTAPEESSALSDRVVFDVGPSAVPSWWRRWWWLLALALLLLAVIAVAGYLLSDGDDGGDGQSTSTQATTTSTIEPTTTEPTTTEPTTTEPTTTEPTTTVQPIGNLIASPDNADCAVSGGTLQVFFYLLLIGANPDDLPGLVSVTAESDSGARRESRSSVSNQAQTISGVPLGSTDYGRENVLIITVDSTGEVPETDESDNAIRVRAQIPPNPSPGQTVPCVVTRP